MKITESKKHCYSDILLLPVDNLFWFQSGGWFYSMGDKVIGSPPEIPIFFILFIGIQALSQNLR